MDVNAFFQLTYGIYIIASSHKGQKNGFIGNAVFQVTATPPTIAISVNRENYTHHIIRDSKGFSISVLTKSAHKNIIQTFGYKSGKDIDKFKDIDWKIGENNLPLVISDCSAVFECRVIKQSEVGTHTIFVGEVIAAEMLSGGDEPLTYSYYRNVFKGKAPEKAPTYIDETKLHKNDEPVSDGIFVCRLCLYEYDPRVGDPEHGIVPGTSFNDLPEDWVCPLCGAGKEEFDEKHN